MIPVTYTAKISPNDVDPKRWIESYRNSLFKYAIARLRDADLAEETIQETFLAALQSQRGFQGLASEKTWLISILKRKIYDHFRRDRRDKKFKMNYLIAHLRFDVSDGTQMPVASSRKWFSDPSKVYEQKEFLKILGDALSKLPERTAQAFVLREVIELSSREICEFMNLSICNLYVMVHRARKCLKNDLQLRWLH
jgi:RNA polymerase sigma-70 factor (ECF subfamily)